MSNAAPPTPETVSDQVSAIINEIDVTPEHSVRTSLLRSRKNDKLNEMVEILRSPDLSVAGVDSGVSQKDRSRNCVWVRMTSNRHHVCPNLEARAWISATPPSRR